MASVGIIYCVMSINRITGNIFVLTVGEKVIIVAFVGKLIAPYRGTLLKLIYILYRSIPRKRGTCIHLLFCVV